MALTSQTFLKKSQFYNTTLKVYKTTKKLSLYISILWSKWYFKTVQFQPILSKSRMLRVLGEVEVFVRWELSVRFNWSLFWVSVTLSCYLIDNYHMMWSNSHLTDLLGRFRDFENVQMIKVTTTISVNNIYYIYFLAHHYIKHYNKVLSFLS